MTLYVSQTTPSCLKFITNNYRSSKISTVLKMSGQTPPPSKCTIDPYKFLQITVNRDGTITRDPNRYPNSLPSADLKSPNVVLSQDIPINQQKNTWVRLFLPRLATPPSPDSSTYGYKLPLIVYFHGGGFINCSAGSTVFHDFCSKMALEVSAVVVSVDYRLSPEHRLPAAYDDAVEVIHWIRNTQIDWLRTHADYDRFFIMGSSAGANIAYQAGLRVSEEIDHNLDGLKIRGLILHHPFIGGVQRKQSEVRLVNDSHLPQSVSDLMWEFALPIGVDRDHEYCNPTVDDGSILWENIERLGWEVLVTGCDGDPMIDRQMEVVEMLKVKNVKVESHFREGGYHVVELKEAPKAQVLFALMNHFIGSST
ncbi:probable carboxylesterase 120 [Mercurialis annua]|uniref:probable carboxylesterase 120 n=1 Tax=Mercurialis annua TaxID=3986 RepID=UPI00215EABC6|nr:probable carboxylesterase 120 [Mercurialis annua]